MRIAKHSHETPYNGVTSMDTTRLSFGMIALSVLAGCSFAFDKIHAGVPSITVQPPYPLPLRVGFRTVGASTPMKLEEEAGSSCWGSEWPTPFPYGQVLKETAAGALGQLFEGFEEVKPGLTYDLMLEAKLDRMSLRRACGASPAEHIVAIGSMRALGQEGRQVWASIKNEARRIDPDPDRYISHAEMADAIREALNSLVKGWADELQGIDMAEQIIGWVVIPSDKEMKIRHAIAEKLYAKAAAIDESCRPIFARWKHEPCYEETTACSSFQFYDAKGQPGLGSSQCNNRVNRSRANDVMECSSKLVESLRQAGRRLALAREDDRARQVTEMADELQQVSERVRADPCRQRQ